MSYCKHCRSTDRAVEIDRKRTCPVCNKIRSGIWSSNDAEAHRLAREKKVQEFNDIQAHRSCFAFAGDIADVMV